MFPSKVNKSLAKQVGEVIEVVEGVETKLQCVSSASKPKTQLDWIFQGKPGPKQPLYSDQAVRGKLTFANLDLNLIIRHTGLQKHVHKIDNYQGP